MQWGLSAIFLWKLWVFCGNAVHTSLRRVRSIQTSIEELCVYGCRALFAEMQSVKTPHNADEKREGAVGESRCIPMGTGNNRCCSCPDGDLRLGLPEVGVGLNQRFGGITHLRGEEEQIRLSGFDA